ncbi:helix-turn-helix domain-containing protein [Salmonella enterica]|nr:helix-turn-helix domain-containing protein [Salmonella enterica]
MQSKLNKKPYLTSQPIGVRILERRRELGMSQAAVAASMEVSMAAVSLWEKGKTTISSDNLVKLASVLKCQAHWLLYGENTPEASLFDPSPEKVARQDPLQELMSASDPSVREELVHLSEIYINLPSNEREEIMNFAQKKLEDHAQALVRLTKKHK